MVVQFLNMTILSNADSQEYLNVMIFSQLMMIIVSKSSKYSQILM